MVKLRVVRGVGRLPRRKAAAHKGDFGVVGIVAGSATMLGAAILCARAAVRSGAGLVRLVLPRPCIAPALAAVPTATALVRGATVPSGCSALVIGPGLGTSVATARLVTSALQGAQCPLVLDADALNVLAGRRAGWRKRVDVVWTPHPGEAARVLGTSSAAVQADREQALLALHARLGGVVVLKGAGTLVTDGVHLYRNATGNPGLATAGSGDVLAGALGALLAQGLLPFDAACLAVRVHGAAADLVVRRLSEPGLSAEDLPLAIAEVLRS